jgi:hypothetical protein
VTATETTLTTPGRQKTRFLPAVEVGSGLLHGYRHSLWWHTPGPAMLVPYARTTVYLNVARLRGRCSGDRVQMGGREWRRPLQRPASRECSEGGAQSTSDLFRSEDIGAGAVSQDCGAEIIRFRIPELCGFRADQRPGVHEHGHRQRRCDDSTNYTARRYGNRDTRRATHSRCTGERRPVHDLTCRPGHAPDSDGGQGSNGRDGVLVAISDLPRYTAFATITHESSQTTLTAVRDALRRGSRRLQVRRGS